MQRIRANKKVPVIDDIDMENTTGSLLSRRIKERSDKILDSIGIGESAAARARASEEDVTVKRRSVRITENDSSESRSLAKRSSLLANDRDEEDSLAKQRARQSKARLNEIEEEMTAIAEKQAARERRAARLRALVAETAEENDSAAVQSVRISARQEKRTVEF